MEKKYEDRGLLGKGNFGEAKLMWSKETEKYVAVKLLATGKKIDENVEREILIHRSCRHPHITQFMEIGLDTEKKHLWIVMEYATGGELGKKSIAKTVFERSTTEVNKVLKRAEVETRRAGQNHIGTEQILLGLVGEENGTTAIILGAMGIGLERLRTEVGNLSGRGKATEYFGVEMPYTPRAKTLLDVLINEARKHDKDIESEHLLLGLLKVKEGGAVQVLSKLDANFDKICELASSYLKDKGVPVVAEDNEFTKAGGEEDGKTGKPIAAETDKSKNVIDKEKICIYEEKQARKYFQQLISGVNYLHSMQICHRDLKLENALLDLSGSTPQLKICDFGYAKSALLHSRPKSTVGTAAYIAPEVFSQRQYNGKLADIWSCGVALYVMVVGKFPFIDQNDDMNYRKTMEKIIAVDYKIPKEHFSEDAIDLLEKIFVANPSKRITMREIKRHPFFLKELPDDLSEKNQEQFYVRDDPRFPLQSIDEIKSILKQASLTEPENAGQWRTSINKYE